MGLRLPRPQPFLADRVQDRFERPVRVPSAFKLVLATLIGLSGLGLLTLGVQAFFRTFTTGAPQAHPVAGPLVNLLLAAMGYGFAYVGWRLLRTRATNDALLGPRARLVCGFVIAICAVDMCWNFVVDPGVHIGVLALFTSVWAVWMFYSTLSRRHADREALRNPPARGSWHR